MEIPIHHEKLEEQRIVLKTAGFFKGPQILLYGNPVKGKRGKYTFQDSMRNEIILKVRNNFLDPIPKVEIDGEEIKLARPLTWYEYIWMGLPIILVFAGGGLGAFIGIMATYSSSRIFRSERSNLSKYMVTGMISVSAIVIFFIIAVTFEMLIRGIPKE